MIWDVAGGIVLAGIVAGLIAGGFAILSTKLPTSDREEAIAIGLVIAGLALAAFILARAFHYF